MTLLEKALTVRPTRHTNQKRNISKDDIELGLAWAKDLIVFKQVCAATGLEGSNAYNYLAVVLREAFRKGLSSVDK